MKHRRAAHSDAQYMQAQYRGLQPAGAACLERLVGAEGRAGEHHLAGRLQADQARQALRAAKARQDAQLQLRQAQLRAWGPHMRL